MKREYGVVEKGSVVVDVGANIGVFSLFAALSGAKKVYAFEPSKEAFQVLCENIESNRLTDTIIPFNNAVSGSDGETVRFPRSSSPYNKIERKPDEPSQDYVDVQTVTLNSFLSRTADSGDIDLLKLDCEGAEFDILPALSETTIARIQAIRMECHGTPDTLIEDLCKKGFAVSRRRGHSLWLTRRRT